jgi:hypothetical protein
MHLKAIVINLLLWIPLIASTQNKEELGLIVADSTWSSEIIPFPVDWLPKLTFKGFEELRFAPNWSQSEHQEFWTLAMAWQVESNTVIPLENIRYNFNHYFTELMKPNHWAQEFPEPILELNDLDATNSGLKFKGTMTFFDGFHTGKAITVNILGNQILCDTTGQSVILFKLSPQDDSETIWNDLNAITINQRHCID